MDDERPQDGAEPAGGRHGQRQGESGGVAGSHSVPPDSGTRRPVRHGPAAQGVPARHQRQPSDERGHQGEHAGGGVAVLGQDDGIDGQCGVRGPAAEYADDEKRAEQRSSPSVAKLSTSGTSRPMASEPLRLMSRVVVGKWRAESLKAVSRRNRATVPSAPPSAMATSTAAESPSRGTGNPVECIAFVGHDPPEPRACCGWRHGADWSGAISRFSAVRSVCAPRRDPSPDCCGNCSRGALSTGADGADGAAGPAGGGSGESAGGVGPGESVSRGGGPGRAGSGTARSPVPQRRTSSPPTSRNAGAAERRRRHR